MSNIITAISDFISGAVTKTFEAVEIFLLKIELIGLNTLEILLFILFISLFIMLLVSPGFFYKYYLQFKKPLNKFIQWTRK